MLFENINLQNNVHIYVGIKRTMCVCTRMCTRQVSTRYKRNWMIVTGKSDCSIVFWGRRLHGVHVVRNFAMQISILIMIKQRRSFKKKKKKAVPGIVSMVQILVLLLIFCVHLGNLFDVFRDQISLHKTENNSYLIRLM